MSYMDQNVAFAPAGGIQDLSFDEIDQVGDGNRVDAPATGATTTNVRKKMSALKIFLISIITLITFTINLTLWNIGVKYFTVLVYGLSIFLMIKVMNYKADPK